MDNKKNLKQSVLSGLFWKFGERILAQIVTFVVSVVLARILGASKYGEIAYVNIFIAIANVFVVSGFGNSLVQKKDSDETDFSSVFYINILISVVLYAVIFFTAPALADWLSMPILSPALRVLGLKLIVAGINNVQHAYVARHMLFKKFFWSTLGGTVISGIVGIWMAYKGFGIWAIVAQYMTNTIVDTIVLFITVKWYPKLLFSFKRLGKLFSYGWKLLLSALLDTGYTQLRGFFIGKLYTKENLAYYEKGKQFPNLLVTNINDSIQSVLFPAMSDCQDDKEKVKSITRHSIRTSSYIMLPLMIGLAFVAEPFIGLLLGEGWLDCVPFLQICCVTFSFMPIHTANLQAIKAIGRSDVFLKLEIIKKVLGIAILLLVIRRGVMAIALSGIVSTIFSSIVNISPNRKFINYGFFEQMKDLFNCIVPLALMCASVYGVGLLISGTFLKLALQVVTGAIVYILISFITKNETFKYILSTLKGFIKR